MLFPDLTCVGDQSIREFTEVGVYDFVDTDAAYIVTISTHFKVVVNGSYDRTGENSDFNRTFLESHKEQIWDITTYGQFEDRGRSVLALYINTGPNYRVFSLYYNALPGISQRDAAWLFRYSQLYYQKVLVHNESVQTKNYLDHIFLSTQSPILTFDHAGRIVACNPAAQRLFRLDDVPQLIADREKNAQLYDAVSQAANHGQKIHLDLLPVTLGDDRVLLSTAISPIRNSKNQIVGAVMVSADVTQKIFMEHELERLKQYGLLGEVAVGLAHDVKTPLTTIRGCAKQLSAAHAEDDGVQSVANIINYETHQIDQVIREMMSFGDVTKQTSWLDLNEVLETCISVAHRQRQGRSITIHKSLDPGLPVLRGSNTHMQQIFLNILLNAVQAIDPSGEIFVVSQYDSSLERVRVSIRDTGSGMTEEARERAFEPYFTSKVHGTGMGLSVVKRVLEQYHGSIELETEDGRGTEFHITLPIM